MMNHRVCRFGLYAITLVMIVLGINGVHAQVIDPLSCDNPTSAYVQFDGHLYCLANEEGKSWDEARVIAASKNVTLSDGTVLKGHLLTIKSQPEEDFIYSTFRNSVDRFGFGHLWLGAYQSSSDIEPAGNWAWITGEETGNPITEWSYNFLTPGEPRNNIGNPILATDPNLYNIEDALQMLWFCGDRCGRWDDFNRGNLSDGRLLRFVIEFDYVGDNFVDLRAQPAIVSSALWRSNNTLANGWQTVDFDDSAWPAARAPYPIPQLPTELIPGTNAEFMWYDPSGTSNGTNGSVTAFFRYTFHEDLLAVSRPLIGKAHISVDDDYDLYVNGNLVFQNHDNGFANVVDTVDFSSSLRNGKNVVAIQAVDGGWSFPGDRLFERVLFDATVQPQADLVVLSRAGSNASVPGDGRRYDGRAGAFIGHFGGGCNPVDMAYGPDQKLYIADTDHPRFGGCDPSFAVGRFNGKTGEFDEIDDPFAHFVNYFIEVPAGRLGSGAGGLTFGPDGNLYISDPGNNSIHRYQGPFGSSPGQFMDTFVPAGRGGLTEPRRLQFGPDNSLYVVSGTTDHSAILRYQGPLAEAPGAFIDTFIPTGSGGQRQAADLVFGRDRRLYVANVGPSAAQPSAVLRYEGPAAPIPGAFIDQLVTLAYIPSSLAFGSDWDLYVSNVNDVVVGGLVNRYDGPTGIFKGSFASTDRALKIIFSAVPNYVADLGDFNHDSCVDRTDLNMILADIQAPGPHNTALFDLNGDGKVNIVDSRKLVLLFTNPQGASCP